MYGDAVRVLEAGRRTSPDDYFIYAGLAASYAQLGRKDEAARAVVDVRRVWPFFKVDDFVAQFQGEADRALWSYPVSVDGVGLRYKVSCG